MSNKKLHYVRSKSLNIPLQSNFLESLYKTSHGNVVEVKKYRPKSVSTVYRHTDKPICSTNHIYGKQTKASILGNLRRSQSAQNICSQGSWLPVDKRLCQIRCTYTNDKATLNSKMTEKSSCAIKMKPKSTSSACLPIAPNIKSVGVNTDMSLLSLQQWHGASWQKKLPLMYNRREHHEVYASKPVRWKSTLASKYYNTNEV